MKVLIGVLLSLLVSAGIIYHFNNSSGDSYTGSPFYYTCATSKTPPGLNYGWPVNGSLMLIDYYSAFRILSGEGQYIASSLWKNIPKHDLLVSDPNIMVAYASDSKDQSMKFFLLINQTKWPFLGGGNQTSSFGISADKMITTTMSFLDGNYPTTYYLPFPY